MDPAAVQQAIDPLPRRRLTHLPTPLQACPHLSEHLGGPRIFVKRDDLTGLAFGGNKSRYLEFTLGEALAQGADAVVLSAVVHSNHCRQFAAAAARLGLRAVVVLRQSESPMGRCEATGNYLLDQLFGARIRLAPPERVQEVVAGEMEALRRQGYTPFTGFSALLSRVAYVQCALELVQQSAALDLRPEHIFIGSGGNSLAGLIAGFALLGRQPRFVGVPQHRESSAAEAASRLVRAARQTAAHLGLSCAPDPGRIELDDRHLGPGFGWLDEPTRRAIHLLARTEGILVDPTYSGKAFAGLVAQVREGRLKAGEDTLFVHTGGTPLVFLYGEELALRGPGVGIEVQRPGHFL